jgi:hypothetical protein
MMDDMAAKVQHYLRVKGRARGGKKHDLEVYSSDRGIEPQALRKRHLPLQTGHASGRGSVRTPSKAASMGVQPVERIIRFWAAVPVRGVGGGRDAAVKPTGRY